MIKYVKTYTNLKIFVKIFTQEGAMDEFNQPTQEQQTQNSTQIPTVTETQNETKIGLESLTNLPKIEDLLRSEKEVKSAPEIKGLKKVENSTLPENKTFTLKQDENKAFVKKRVKVLTTVYISVACLLFGLVFANAITLAVLSGRQNSNTNTIKSRSEQAEMYKTLPEEENSVLGSFTYSINEPRDYSDDTKELTFFDKLSILFRNLFS